MAAFIDFVLYQLPQPPGRVLEIGCGPEGGLVTALVEAGYDVLGVDPRAPAGERFVQARFEEVDLGAFDAVVAERVLHHVDPLGAGLERLAAAAPLVLVDEFAWDLLDEPAQEWYEGQYRLLRAAGVQPPGPPSLDEWRERHAGELHPHGLLLAALRERWQETALEWVPYLHRWLGGPASEGLEEALTGAGAFPAIGWRWAGSRHPVAASG